MVNEDKVKESLAQLEHALTFEDRIADDYFYMAGISKCYEVSLEYCWKHLRDLVVDQGLEAYGPKDVIRTAGRLSVIEDVELWISFINDRKLAVRDNADITDLEYIDSAKRFLKAARKLRLG